MKFRKMLKRKIKKMKKKVKMKKIKKKKSHKNMAYQFKIKVSSVFTRLKVSMLQTLRIK